MASEIRVDKINSLSGVGTVTLSPTGVDIAGITTAATLRATTGIVTSLTAGSLTSLGAVSGTTGTFSGAVSGTTGTFSGAVSGTTGTFSDTVSITDNIQHTGDTNTQIRFPSDDTVTVETAGSERARIDSSGNFLVRTTALNNSSVDGQALQIHGTTRPTLILRGNADNNQVAEIQFADNSGSDDSNTGVRAGLIQYSHASNFMAFRTSATERLRIDNNGRMGLKTTNPSDNIHVAESGATNNYIRFSNSNISNGWSVGAQSGGRFQIVQNGVADRFFIESDGNVTVNSGSLKIGTAGQGINFDGFGAGGVSNLLDDYEEGSYNATVTLGSGTITNTFSNTILYTKIGRVVHLIGRLYTAHSQTDVTTYQFTIPFACIGGGSAVESGGALKVFRANAVSGEHPDGFRAYRIESGNSYAKLAANTTMDGGNFGTTNPHIIVNCTYHAA